MSKAFINKQLLNKTPHSSGKIWVFRIIALVLPFVLIGLVEIALRLSGYGQHPPLFIDNPSHPEYKLTNPQFAMRYFNQDLARAPVELEPHFFLKDKPDNGVRLFVQGGSTAAGYPYGLGGSIAGILEHRVRASMPKAHVEVINTALSAVNSYTLLDMADDIIDQAPDAVLIYAGHNEYIGLLGVGSQFSVSHSRALTLTYLYFSEWRLFKLLQKLLNTFNSDAPDAFKQNRTMMAQVAKERVITRDSALFSAGIQQYRANMQALLLKYRAAGIPVFLSTIASNEADHVPFSREPISPSQQALLDRLRNGYSPTHLMQLQNTVQREQHALLAYQTGQLCEAQQQWECAKAFYNMAKEHDALRFRAPNAINDVIVSLADKFAHVTLVDAHNYLAARHPHGLIGDNVMLEHLHPNVSGYFVIANAFYDSVSALLPQALATNQDQAALAQWQTVDVNTAWQRRTVTEAEEIAAFADIAVLTSDYPYQDEPIAVVLPKPSNAIQAKGLAFQQGQMNWLELMKAVRTSAIKQDKASVVTTTSLLIADALPHDPLENLRAAQYAMRNQRLPEALYYFLRAQRAGALNLDKQINQLQQRLGQ